jgi:hypothetical protein
VVKRAAVMAKCFSVAADRNQRLETLMRPVTSVNGQG